MSDTIEEVSAFAVYSVKRKNVEQSEPKQFKKKRSSSENSKENVEKNTKQSSNVTAKTDVKKIQPITVSTKTSLNSKQPRAAAKKKRKKKLQKLDKNNEISESKVLVQNTQTENKRNSKEFNHESVKSKKKEGKAKVKVKHTVKKSKQRQESPGFSYGHLHCDKVSNEEKDPLVQSKELFEWVIHPLPVEDFFKNNWEKTPVHIKRNKPSYYKFLMSTPALDKILRKKYVLFTKNIDITSYTNGVRETHNPPGRAMPSVVWDYYLNGCSVRMLNPQTFIPKLYAFNATLQEFFGCFVGANSYLTPPNSQGFAPHYDDIEAFILQVEGKKRWRLYKPRNENEYLPRYSSKNFDQSEIGEPILDTVVNAGDLLYFPRGTIHQGETIDDTHSLHITLSVYQKNSWSDFFEKLLPEALKQAIENDSQFREGLPLDYLRYTGYAHTDKESDNKKMFKEKVKDLFSQLVDYLDIDKAADLMGRDHVHDFLPPALTEYEEECSVAEDGEEMVDAGVVENRVEIEPDTEIRLTRSHCVRLVEEEDTFRLYYSTENSKEYHEYDLQFLEVGQEFLPAVKEIIARYPEFIRVEDLPIEGEDNKIQIAKDLWEKCIVVTSEPLVSLD